MRERADNARPIETATQDPTHWQAEADFVVIGSGAAGLMAALSASEAGKSVVLLERSEKIGGTTAFSGALLWVPLNPKGKEIGFIDDRDAAISYILATMGQSADRTRVEAFVDSAGETIEFLERHSPIQLLNTPYPDTFIEAVGGVASGRHLEPAYFSLRKLGAWRHRLRKPANPAMFTFREMIAQGFVAGLKRIIFRNIHAIVWRLIAAKRCGGTALVAAQGLS